MTGDRLETSKSLIEMLDGCDLPKVDKSGTAQVYEVTGFGRATLKVKAASLEY